ncbi:chitinase [Cupriavidus pauculus]|uniref:glycoside hydrolase family 19 protein n=4 Tax=Cupriavidus pauculus TaxID=82633 RepID=UPI001CC1441A|nr:chitinase [Cupriavidus pauculus]UAL00210.1 chitinase [Cupriavidus pauculus]
MAKTTPANTPDTKVKLLAFAFPFRKKGEGNAAGKNITDEHEFHALLKKEASGHYAVSAKGMWHGGIHISEGGAGASLDLKYGVRCIADGEVVAFRVNRNYLVSQMPAEGDKPAREAHYSTGFALVRHAMEFPKGTKLTFFSLYMHLQDMAGYESDKALPRPAYWQPDFTVTQFANDKPAGRPTSATPSGQVGLRVRATHPHGTPLCILPRGTQVSISKREGNWGQIKDTHWAQLIPPKVGGYVAPTAAIGGWMFLGKEHGHRMVEAVIPDSMLDRVVTLDKPVKIKAGDLIGHLGRYDSLSNFGENRMVHIEVFCDDGIKAFIQKGRDWIDNHGHHPDDWKPLGLSSEPTLMRIDKNTKLYKQPFNEGAAPSMSDVIQIVALAELARNPDNKRMETTAVSGEKLPWWHVNSADVLGHDIDGWVRQENFAGGRVTREFAQSWIDFDTSFEDPHDSTHTMFATAKAYVDYSMGADVPAPAAMSKLSQLMVKIYRAIFPRGDGGQAADELCAATDDPWRALRVSRLIIKHESEWANPNKWQQLIREIEEHTGPQPQHVEEQKRVERLVWWDDVKAGVSDLPGSDVFHIHPIGLVGNFSVDACSCQGRELSAASLKRIATYATDQKIQEYIDALNQAFSDYSFDTCLGRAHFIAQVLAESGEFKHTRELGEKLAYDPWRGRGLIQVTFEANYRDYEAYSGEDVTSNSASMSKLERAPHAILSAAWFYTKQASLMAASDADDFIWIVRKINGDSMATIIGCHILIAR